MKNIFALLALVALFALSCTKSTETMVLDNQTDASMTSLSVKGGDEENPEETVVDEETEDPNENEGEVEGEEEGEEENEEEGEENEPAEIDPAIVAFVETHFPEVGIASCGQEEDCHSVKLEDGTQINFDANFEWKKVSCKHSTVYTFVPESIVPEAITAYVNENYLENTIMDIKKTGFGWMVTLNNKGKIKFNSDFSIK